MTHVKQARAVDSESFGRILRVSRETIARLESYALLLESWQRRVNLIGESTRRQVWQRHFLDSAQVFPLLPDGAERLLDIGSGAGFPGLVLGIMGVPEVHLVEANQRKAVFLREAARITNTSAIIHSQRIESLEPFPVDIVTSRAVAKVNELLDYARPFIQERTMCVFLKGESAQQEVEAARRSWSMRVTCIPSLSDPGGVVIRLEDIRNA